MKAIVIIVTILVAQNAMAFDKDSSMGDLQNALMQSNKDYNDSKKLALQEDNQRITNWNQHETTTIEITADIKAEARDYQGGMEVAPTPESKDNLAETEKQEVKTNILHEVSMNN